MAEFDKRLANWGREMIAALAPIIEDARTSDDLRDAEFSDLKNKLVVAERTITLLTNQVSIAQKRENEALEKNEAQAHRIVVLENDLQDIKDRIDRIPGRAERPSADTPYAKVSEDVRRRAKILESMEAEMAEPQPEAPIEPLSAIAAKMKEFLGAKATA